MLSGDDARFLKKNLRTTGIDVHPTERALVVKYYLEATILGQLGDPMVGEKKECQKIIRLKDLSPSTDIGALAKEVVDKCKLISSTKLPEVEQLLYYLQNRKETRQGSAKTATDGAAQEAVGDNFEDFGSEIDERASINNIDDYIELLYDDIAEKIRGTALVLQLARNPDNLEELMANETLLGALARVLREDWKKNMELATNIAYVFFCFSTFSQFHNLVSHFKIGAMCLQILEYESKRYISWKEDLAKKGEDAKAKIKYQLLCKKQEQLLRVCFYLLLNLSEDVKVELKMVNRGIVVVLTEALERKTNRELLVLALTFLKKLSIFVENKNQMAKNKIVQRVSALFPTKSDEVATAAVKLLMNLSFDTAMRAKMVQLGLLNHLVPLLENESLRLCTLKLLYHLSMDDECKSMVTYTDCIPISMALLLDDNASEVKDEVKALLVNLALEKRNAQLLAGENAEGLRVLMEKAFAERDSLILKILKNIASHDGTTKAMFVEYIKDLADTARRQLDNEKRDSDSFAFGLECLGIIGCLNLADLDWARLLEESELVPWLQRTLTPGAVEDDVLLEVVVLLGTVASDEDGSQILLDHGIINTLIGLLSAKQEDDEIVLQIIYVFYQTMFHDSIRPRVLSETQVPAYLIDLMHDKNKEIRRMCDNTLEVIAEHGEEWASKIQEEKFKWHNAQWLEMVSDGRVDAREPTRFALDADAQPPSQLFNDLYGLQAEDILDNYDSDGRDSQTNYGDFDD